MPENQRLVFLAHSWLGDKAADVLVLPLSFLFMAPNMGDTKCDRFQVFIYSSGKRFAGLCRVLGLGGCLSTASA